VAPLLYFAAVLLTGTAGSLGTRVSHTEDPGPDEILRDQPTWL